MAKKTSLNKGLEALLGDVVAPKETKTPTKKTTTKTQSPEISISKIKTNQYQPRTTFDEKRLQELSESIKKHGVVQPILVREEGSGFELVAGERRMRASKLAGLKKIPAVITKATDIQSLEIAILENVQREDLNSLEVSKGYQRLKDEFGYTQEQVAKSVGKPRSSIANSLRLLTLSPKIQAELEKGTLTEGHAKVLLGIDAAQANTLLETILKEKFSVRDLEKMLAGRTSTSPKPSSKQQTKDT
jgi:ParB-like partition proteins